MKSMRARSIWKTRLYPKWGFSGALDPPPHGFRDPLPYGRVSVTSSLRSGFRLWDKKADRYVVLISVICDAEVMMMTTDQDIIQGTIKESSEELRAMDDATRWQAIETRDRRF